MSHILDNPIYYSLKTSHQHFSEGNEELRFYDREIASFAGFKDYSNKSFEAFSDITPSEGVFIVFSPIDLSIPAPWRLMASIDMFQFIYEQKDVAELKSETKISDLNVTHVNEMTALVELTKPGPFLKKTIDLSNYTGIFEEGKLVAMAGHRFHCGNYIEISAVCTHPDFSGKGYAYAIIKEQIKRIIEKSQIPFLHVRKDNDVAITLYKKLGFKVRIEMKAFVFKKQLLV